MNSIHLGSQAPLLDGEAPWQDDRNDMRIGTVRYAVGGSTLVEDEGALLTIVVRNKHMAVGLYLYWHHDQAFAVQWHAYCWHVHGADEPTPVRPTDRSWHAHDDDAVSVSAGTSDTNATPSSSSSTGRGRVHRSFSPRSCEGDNSVTW